MCLNGSEGPHLLFGFCSDFFFFSNCALLNHLRALSEFFAFISVLYISSAFDPAMVVFLHYRFESR